MSMMKQMMEGMMPLMMKGISAEEKQQMMLNMMPMMMADVDMAELMPRMMATMLPDVMKNLSDFLAEEDAADQVLDRMATVMPTMCEMMDKEQLARRKDAMVARLMERDSFRQRMPHCFAHGMPIMVRGCFEHFMPELSKEERQRLMATLIGHLLTYGAEDFTDQEKRALLALSDAADHTPVAH